MDAVLLLTIESSRRTATFLLPSLRQNYRDLATLLLGDTALLVPKFAGWRPPATEDAGRRPLFNEVASRPGIAVDEVAARLKSVQL